MLQRLFARWRRPAFAIDELEPAQLDSQNLTRALARDMLADRRAERRARLAKPLIYAVMILGPVLILRWLPSPFDARPGPSSEAVGVVELAGEMADGKQASAERVIPALRRAFENERVKAVVLSIDSPGGAPLEAERIYTAIDSWRASHPKPVIAVINNVGASAAYMVALHCDEIYAGKYSLVGSIGAVLSGWDFHKALERVDVGQRVYASGNLKAMLNPYLPMSPEADHKAKDLVTKMGRQFVDELEAERKGKLATGVDFGSGEIWGGLEAHKLGLIDGVSTLDQVVKSRWPDLKMHGFGPGNANGLPLIGSSVVDALREVGFIGPSGAQAVALR
ncbi:S49 family peptidase [Ideonella sp. YS5]|uniref:S49 family peptidase n=1 Tax=Ideonella sp. YS5 TaxID=3453714 RepID=UPI003EEBA866